MARTNIPTDMTVEQWDDEYFEEFVNEDFFKKFKSTREDGMIRVREDLTKKPGDAIHITLRNRLKGRAKNQDELLEGQEEPLVFRDFEVRVREYSHATEYRRYDEQLTPIALRQAHKGGLMMWNKELMRDQIIRAMHSVNGVPFADADATTRNAWCANNADRVLFGAAKSNNTGTLATSLANIDSTNDKLASGVIGLMKRMAKTATPKVTPLTARTKIDASDSYVMFVHPYHERDLETDTVFMAANREARMRGLDNPIFSGANYIYKNVAVYVIEELPIVTGAGAGGIDVAPVFLCGQGALTEAIAKRPFTEEEKKSYGQLQGLAVFMWCEWAKNQFGTGASDKDTPKDYGLATGYFSAVAD